MNEAVAALPGIAAIVAIALFADLRRPWTIAALAACGVMIDAVTGGGASVGAIAVPHLPLLLFLLAEAATYRLADARWGIERANLRRLIFGTLVWAVAAHLLWIDALFALRAADTVARWLPLATGAVQLLFALGIPGAIALVRGKLTLTELFCDPLMLAQPAARVEVFRGPAGGRRTAWIICYAGVSDQPRIIRQGRALVDDGWRVVVCGFDGHSPRPPDWTYIRLPGADAFNNTGLRLLHLVRNISQFLVVFGRPRGWFGWAGRLYHALMPPYWLHLRWSLLKVLRGNRDLLPDLVIAHNYYTADTGYQLAVRSAAKFSVDCHEYSAEEELNDVQWVRWKRPYIMAMQNYYLTRADVVTTICDGIAELLGHDHPLRRPAATVRNVSLKEVQPFRPVGERIKVLYHGDISIFRQLHTAIESMPLWRPEFDLVLRGNGDAAYIAELHRLVSSNGLEHRVFFEPAVPFDRIVVEANKADIGYFSYANFSRQSEFVLPNKFFEYIMAGLALCVADLTEMRRLTQKYGLGRLIEHHSPAAIAEAINGFTPAEIDRCKGASLAAAEELNWDREQRRLIEVYNSLFTSTVPTASSEADFAREAKMAIGA
jgi:glycosyltransferase involved in cell wall biosynthesis